MRHYDEPTSNAYPLALVLALILILAGYVAVAMFSGSDFQEEHLPFSPAVPVRQTTSPQQAAILACNAKANVVVVHYVSSSTSNQAELLQQKKELEILNRHFAYSQVAVIEVDLDGVKAKDKPHDEPAIDIAGIYWNTSQTAVTEIDGPSQTSWRDYPQGYSELREAVDNALEAAEDSQALYETKTPPENTADCATFLSIALTLTSPGSIAPAPPPIPIQKPTGIPALAQ